MSEPREPPDGAAETRSCAPRLRRAARDGSYEAPTRPAALARSRSSSLPPARGEAGLVGVLRPASAARARSCTERDGDAIGGLEPAGPPIGSGAVARLAVHVPGAAAQARRGRRRLRSRDRRLGGEDRARSTTSAGDARAAPRRRSSRTRRCRARSIPAARSRRRCSRRRSGGSRDPSLAGDETLPRVASRSCVREPLRGPRRCAQDDLEAAKRARRGLDATATSSSRARPARARPTLGARLIVAPDRSAAGASASRRRATRRSTTCSPRSRGSARAEGVEFRGLKKGDVVRGPVRRRPPATRRASPSPTTTCCCSPARPGSSRARTWTGVVDTLFVDEAGQVSLADALAMATCARNLVLLGDPQQLAQVSQGTHPEGAAASVLEHLLGGEDTIPPDRGLFLGAPGGCTRRLPLRLRDRPTRAGCTRRRSARCSGRPRLRHRAALPAGRARGQPAASSRGGGRGSRAEIERHASAATCTDCDGRRRARSADTDFIVVAPYNAQVRCLRAALLGGRARSARSTSSRARRRRSSSSRWRRSSGEDVPRSLEFLFSRNRLNVAISRARCLAFLVASPQLLEIRCRTVEQMRLVNALCRFVELAP